MIAHASPLVHGALVVGGIVAVTVFGVGWVRREQSTIRHLLAWILGVASVLVALTPAFESWAERSFTGHMVQHLLLIALAAPLLVVSAPVETVRPLVSHPRGSGRAMRAVRRSWRRHGPPVAAAAFVGVLVLTHLTSFYDRALQNRTLHDVEHVAYLGTAVVLWAALRSGTRSAAPARLGAVFAVIAATAFLGVVLLSASEPLMATYEARLGRADALDDQRLAASLMWVGGMATTLPLLILSVWNWAAAEERATLRAESYQTRLHPAAPTRSVADRDPTDSAP